MRGPGWLGYEETIELSSGLTPVYKIAFPVALGGGLILAAAVGAWEIAVPFLVALPVLLLLAAPLKRVQLRGTTLVVSNYFRSCEIECAEMPRCRRNVCSTSAPSGSSSSRPLRSEAVWRSSRISVRSPSGNPTRWSKRSARLRGTGVVWGGEGRSVEVMGVAAEELSCVPHSTRRRPAVGKGNDLLPRRISRRGMGSTLDYVLRVIGQDVHRTPARAAFATFT